MNDDLAVWGVVPAVKRILASEGNPMVSVDGVAFSKKKVAHQRCSTLTSELGNMMSYHFHDCAVLYGTMDFS